jgi:stage V sporulation protein D (sporulation-specific penicillin-binding protein)
MSSKRFNLFLAGLILATLAILIRLFYWQVIAAEKLAAIGESQHQITYEIPQRRGEIKTSDGFPLATNKKTFLVFAYTPQLDRKIEDVATALAPILAPNFTNEASATALERQTSPETVAKKALLEKLTREDVLWIPLLRNAQDWQKQAIEKLDIKGLGIESSFSRDYPEASMAASLLGFVGSDIAGNPKGYFGIEGFYDLELKGRPGLIRHEKDASGKPILIGKFDELEAKDGRSLVLNLDRAIQRLVEERLKEGLEKYQAKSGEVVILDPRSGAVIALAALPSYDPAKFQQFAQEQFKNPVVSETYEPGSAFKVLVMSAALDAKAVGEDTKCTICDGPVQIGGYTIRTWNNQYHPDSTMKQVIQNSDNVGMVFVANKLGKDKLCDYLTRFGIGEKTGIDLEDETTAALRAKDDWKEIDLATASFGQGIAVTGIQMVRAVAAVANKGIMLVPQVVQKVEGDKTVKIQPKVVGRVISEDTAEKMKEILVNAVENGEAKWAKPKGYRIAGKTGTAQIPVAGHYDAEKTIASFVGFAPPNDPKFVMLVKLREPQSSPWGSETAAPLWFSIAKDLFFYYGIQPVNP